MNFNFVYANKQVCITNVGVRGGLGVSGVFFNLVLIRLQVTRKSKLVSGTLISYVLVFPRYLYWSILKKIPLYTRETSFVGSIMLNKKYRQFFKITTSLFFQLRIDSQLCYNNVTGLKYSVKQRLIQNNTADNTVVFCIAVIIIEFDAQLKTLKQG